MRVSSAPKSSQLMDHLQSTDKLFLAKLYRLFVFDKCCFEGVKRRDILLLPTLKIDGRCRRQHSHDFQVNAVQLPNHN